VKIAYDHQAFTLQDYGGVSRYFFEVMDHLDRTRGVDIDLWLRRSNNAYLEGAAFMRHRHFLPARHFRGKARLLDLLNKPLCVKGLRAGNFDVFHPTYFDPYFLRAIGKKPFVLTIHDMTHELFPQLFSRRHKTAVWKKAVAGKAARILADSHNTKSDIVRLLGIAEDRIDVVYFASSLAKPDGGGRDAEALGLRGRLILFVGVRVGYKNFARFARAVAPLLREAPDLGVICAGGGPFRRAERRFLRELGVAARFEQRDVDDRTLASLYATAELFVFPSLYEGFGVPVIEAFGCGCPVALGRVSSFPEVAGDAAVYFNPADEASIREVVRQILEDGELRTALRAKGEAQSKKFSWAKTAEGALAAYRKAAERQV
jgi:glycosyltransferase involved in cell wall biosynthesis